MFLIPGRRFESWKDGHDAKQQLLQQSRRSNIHLGRRTPVFESSATASFAGLHGLSRAAATANPNAKDSVGFAAAAHDDRFNQPTPPTPVTAAARAPPSKPSSVASHIVFGTDSVPWRTETAVQYVASGARTGRTAAPKLPTTSHLILGYHPTEWTSSTLAQFATTTTPSRTPRAMRPPTAPRSMTTDDGPDRWMTTNDVCESLAASTPPYRTSPNRPSVALHGESGVHDDRDFATATASFFGARPGLMTPRISYEHARHDHRIMLGDDDLDYQSMARQSLFPTAASTTPRAAAARSAPRDGPSHAVVGDPGAATDYQTTFGRDYLLPPVTERRRPVRPEAATNHAIIGHDEASSRGHFLSTVAREFNDKTVSVSMEDRQTMKNVALTTKNRFARASWPAEGRRTTSFETEMASKFTAKTPAVGEKVTRAVAQTESLQWEDETTPGQRASMSTTNSLLNRGRIQHVPLVKAPVQHSHVMGAAPHGPVLSTSNIMSAAYHDLES